SEKLQLALAIALGQGQFKLELAVEMVLDDTFVATGDENEVLDAGLARFVDHVLDQRAINNRKHLLRHCFGCGQEAGAEGGARGDSFANGFHDPVEGWGCDRRNLACFSSNSEQTMATGHRTGRNRRCGGSRLLNLLKPQSGLYGTPG